MYKKIIMMITCLILSGMVNLFSVDNPKGPAKPNGPNMEKGSEMTKPPLMKKELDMKKAATTLGITVEKLTKALGEPGELSKAHIIEAAELLGITEKELLEALELDPKMNDDKPLLKKKPIGDKKGPGNPPKKGAENPPKKK